MATRLMVSLKKAAALPAGPWSIATMTGDHYNGRLPGDGNLRFASSTFDVSHETSETPANPGEEGIELEFTLRLPRKRESQELC